MLVLVEYVEICSFVWGDEGFGGAVDLFDIFTELVLEIVVCVPELNVLYHV